MIIECPNCNKKFDIDQNLIPNDGRLVQCGSCNHKWLFTINITKKKIDEKIKTKSKNNFHMNIRTAEDLIKEELNYEKENINTKSEKLINKINYFNKLLVIIISAAAFILILDTFQNYLISTFPNIDFLLNNLYQSLEDIKLFILDLIK